MAGGGEGNGWIKKLGGGGAIVGVASLVPRVLGHDAVPEWLLATALGLGGLAVVFGSCEAMIKSVEGIGKRLGWNPFVAGTMGGLDHEAQVVGDVERLIVAPPALLVHAAAAPALGPADALLGRGVAGGAVARHRGATGSTGIVIVYEYR
jgi:hypothetical protein